MSAAGRHVALYDGDCAFCTRWRDRMMARDPQGTVEWLSVHDPSVATRYPGIDREDAMRQMWVYAPDGTVHKGAEGWRVLFRVLDGLSWAEWLYRIPGGSFVMDRIYRVVAARRYRLSCRSADCRRPGGGPGGRALGAALLILTLPAAFLQAGCGEAPPDPLVDRLEAVADPEAAAIVRAAFESYGPYGTWKTHRNVEYTYRLQFYGGQKDPQASTLQLHRLDLGPGRRALSRDLEGASPQTVRVAEDRIDVVRGDVPVVDPQQLEFPRAFMRVARFTFLLPWNLLEPEVRLQYRGERTPPPGGPLPSDTCDVVRLTFEEKDPSRKDDWYDLYFSRVNHLIDRVHSYRGEDRSYWVSLWSDHRTFGGVRIATHRETRASDVTGLIGPLEAVTEYSEVHFDAPFGDEQWSGMPETAPPESAAIPAASAGALAAPLATPSTQDPTD